MVSQSVSRSLLESMNEKWEGEGVTYFTPNLFWLSQVPPSLSLNDFLQRKVTPTMIMIIITIPKFINDNVKIKGRALAALY